jgi:YggT family protein
VTSSAVAVDSLVTKYQLVAVHFIGLLIEVYSLVVLVSVMGSWIGSEHPIFKQVDKLVDPVLTPLRERLPPMAGFDLSPMILLIGLQVLASLFR